jgi:uncharacterized protein YlxP (DUF503 family)
MNPTTDQVHVAEMLNLVRKRQYHKLTREQVDALADIAADHAEAEEALAGIAAIIEAFKATERALEHCLEVIK